MSSQLRKGALELCVLSLLLYEDLYGYELIKIISETFPVSEGTIYPILRRLTKNNYLKTYTAASDQGPSRKYYKVTEEGAFYHQTLKSEWLDLSEKVNSIIKEGK
ncbi:PadR family transcriptional regulator [Bacillus velezensis]|uniref:PadR family transcriptional regulator n=1 Tax=Bacillus TaxID=1386 RepID=UPI00025B14F4|nr:MULTISPECIES: PadR family transcriptional regulator [Bacillus]AIW31655.1 PadR family transcriptional regulator [Bacillus subtilis]MBL3612906.1 PadR family transcriptional regulator [Bacillus sp. RHFS18]AMQ72167.1 PadR family transcriptional regulator [Bacillus amyloliquefaciens UMAF6614]ANS40062.1 PadR family transcriptional regulator [Bacillus velezensis]ANU31821.1 PadR family transcriptional regulator [Bacillus velezensis]